ncbi:MAG: 30S ribosomal protein S2 [Patescibacteria group bacterium]
MTEIAEAKNNSFIKELFEAGAYIGYSRARRHPKMRDFVFGMRNNIEIIDLEISEKKINEACEFLKNLGKENKTLLIVGTKPNIQNYVKDMGVFLSMPYVSDRWLGGTLTNFKILSGRVAFLHKLEEEEKSGGFDKYTKKEKMLMKFKLGKLRNMFEGLRNLKSIPDTLIIVDPRQEQTAFFEAQKKNIPIIALMNIDFSPENIKYPIPLNHNSKKAVSLVLERLQKSYDEGRKLPREEAAVSQVKLTNTK